MAKTIPASGRTAAIPPVNEKPIVSEEYARHPRKRKLDWRQIGLAALLIGPNLLLLILFTYRPLVDNIRISFFNWNISSPTMTFVGLQNYIDWFQAPDTGRVVFNTVVFTFFAVVGSMVLGLALALLLDQKLFGRAAVRSMVFAPYVIAGAAIGVAFQFVFDPNYGLIQYFLGLIGVDVPNFYQQQNWALFMITVTYVWKNVGYVFVIYLAALQGRRRDLDEASEIDGTPAVRHFFRVVLPQLRGTTFFLLITVLLNSFQVFDIINAMTGGGPFGYGTSTMVFQVYQETFINNRAGYGAAVATIMFLVVLVITVLQIKLQERMDK
ncbi:MULTISPECIES: carbohydrate ABC transporter permease [Corynebacterium]|uniref:Sugar ABC transporter permease n=2 Tax=Corynebacterium TaxID=1716 RepID=A0A2N6TG50_9CORY|nr:MULTISPECIES: sugar ABC transporter permease [Corynebacterium]KKO76874.1 glycerol-3-phosphate ABC transporter permease [Corynebacterium minutissimum]MTD90591.1 sugar ABC transporter permease [Corynebacterium aurimucosum]OFK65428.1 glycerol-3-phosphate ABC transporter permease [Corynebacterium sp. HMSC076G08]OFK65840.1 glycerol-3-phosphate ABC transporter permease [Corynebacterium sp. HMSC074A09]OFN35471.1 glycerol-3-phosphate ABC transporter permease [Corynebacterium sp. HMSC072A04]